MILEDEHVAFRESFDTLLSRQARRSPQELLAVAARDGLIAPRVPVQYGGAGVEDPRFGLIAAQQAMAAGAHGLALRIGILGEVVVPALLRSATPEQQATWLPRLCCGEAMATVAIGAGAARYVPAGLEADLILVVDRDATALLTRNSVTVEPSDPGIGLADAGFADLRWVVAEPLGDQDEAERVRADLGLVMAATAVAGARAALELAVDYVQERKAFGRPIASFENTQQMLGEAAANLEAGEAFLHSVIAGPLSPARAAALELHCAELFGEVVDTAVQLHGGYGYIMEYPIAHLYADAAFWRLNG